MAKVKGPKAQPPQRESLGPDHLTTRLFAPGMMALHRAGLGGLACTLKYIERAYQQGALSDSDVPGGPWSEGIPPWQIEADQISLRFARPEAADNFLKRLFALAFEIRDGLIELPGQYHLQPNLAIRADLQLGLTLTFLQHGKTRKLTKESIPASYDPDGNGIPAVIVGYRKCSWYKHQDGWTDCVNTKSGCLSQSSVGIEGPLNPGLSSVTMHFLGQQRLTSQWCVSFRSIFRLWAALRCRSIVALAYCLFLTSKIYAHLHSQGHL